MSWKNRDTESGYKNPVLEKKKVRLKMVESMLRNNCPMRYSKAIAMAVYNTGVSRGRAVEYLNYFVDLELIRIENGMIYLINEEAKNKSVNKKTESI